MKNDSGLSVLMAIAKEVIGSLKIASMVLEIFDVKNVFETTTAEMASSQKINSIHFDVKNQTKTISRFQQERECYHHFTSSYSSWWLEVSWENE